MSDGRVKKQAKTRIFRLEPNKNNGHGPRAQVMAFGDWHIGAETCDEEKIEEQIEMCLNRRIYVLGMGDHLETGTRTSVGDSVYKQTMNPDEQMERVIDLMRPLAEEGLLIGMHKGNHEQRLSKDVGIDVMRWICRELKVPYLGHAQSHIWYMGKQSYTVFSTHGSAGARLPWTKIKAAVDCMRFTDAELILYGHTHGLDHHAPLFEIFDKTKKKTESFERHVVLTGSYLRYRGSYAEEKNLPPAKMGSPIISLYSDSHEIRVSI